MQEKLALSPSTKTSQNLLQDSQLAITSSQEITVEEGHELIESARQNYELELVRLEKLHSDLFTAKQALSALQAEHKARLAEFDHSASTRRQELEQALIRLKAQLDSERASFKAELAREISQAENVILLHRQKFLAGQKILGQVRRKTDLQIKEANLQIRKARSAARAAEADMLSEWRENDRADIGNLKRRLVELKIWTHKFKKFRQDLADTQHLHMRAKTISAKLKFLTEENQLLYHQYAFSTEPFDSFIARHLDRFESIKLDTELKIAEFKVGTAYQSKIRSSNPIMLSPEQAKLTEQPLTKTKSARLIEKFLEPVAPKDSFTR